MDWFVQRTTAMDRRNCRVVARTSCLRRCTTVCLACLALLACGGPLPWSQARAHAASSTPPARGTVTLEVEDRSPKFLAFYEAASKDGVTSDRRWELWQSMYGFAAVPPGSDGQAMARNLFDHAWPLYPSVLERIRTQPPIVARDAKEEVIRIADLLELDRDIQVKLLLYVGGLETNAFTFMLDDGVPHVALPVEGPPESMPTLAAHELTHAVHLPLARLPGGWERSMAQTVLTEGLAMHVVKELFPGRPDEAYTEATHGWLEQAKARRAAILEGIRTSLAARDGATVAKFTFGHGTTGLEREAYFVGWLVIDWLLSHGRSYPQIARVPENELVGVVGEALDGLSR